MWGPNVIWLVALYEEEEREISSFFQAHALRKDHVSTHWESGCLQAEKRALTRSWPWWSRLRQKEKYILVIAICVSVHTWILKLTGVTEWAAGIWQLLLPNFISIHWDLRKHPNHLKDVPPKKDFYIVYDLNTIPNIHLKKESSPSALNSL